MSTQVPSFWTLAGHKGNYKSLDGFKFCHIRLPTTELDVLERLGKSQ